MRIMVYDGPRKLRIQEIEEFEIKDNEVRMQSLYSGISHGTEMNVYRGVAPFFRRKFDPDMRLFVDADDSERWSYPIRSCDPGVWYMGYANVSRVIEVGDNVRNIKVGDVVYSDSPHQSQIIKREKEVIKLPETLKPEYGIFLTNLMTTYNGILDTKIKLGDVVVVSGLGLLGQLTAQMCKMSGASKVYGIDMIEKRLKAAEENGIDETFNPKLCSDIAYEIRKRTKGKGADVVIEASGNQRALNEAIRIAAPDTIVTAIGWYQGKCLEIDLSEEFHHNRITIRSSQTGAVNPSIRHMWDDARKIDTCIDLLHKLKLENLITHRIPYNRVAEAYQKVDKDPSDIIQVILVYES